MAFRSFRRLSQPWTMACRSFRRLTQMRYRSNPLIPSVQDMAFRSFRRLSQPWTIACRSFRRLTLMRYKSNPLFPQFRIWLSGVSGSWASPKLWLSRVSGGWPKRDTRATPYSLGSGYGFPEFQEVEPALNYGFPEFQEVEPPVHSLTSPPHSPFTRPRRTGPHIWGWDRIKAFFSNGKTKKAPTYQEYKKLKKKKKSKLSQQPHRK